MAFRYKNYVYLSCALAMLSVLLLGSTYVQAEVTYEPPSSAAAKELITKAEHLVEKGNFAGAIKSYRAAYKIDRSESILYNIGVSYMRLGNPSEALGYFNEYLRREVKPKQEILKDLETLLAQTQAQTADVQQRKQEVIERLCYFGVVSVNCPRNAPVSSQLVSSVPPVSPSQVSPPLDPDERRRPGQHRPDVGTSPDDERSKPVYKKGWFWGVMVASVAVIGVGVGAGIYVATKPHNVNPPVGVTLVSLTFGP